MVWKGKALIWNKSCTEVLNHIQVLAVTSINELPLPVVQSPLYKVYNPALCYKSQRGWGFWRWSFCLHLQITESFLRAMLMWPDYTCAHAWEAVSTTYAKRKPGLMHVFLGAHSLLNEIAACGKEFAVPESTDVCGWGRWGVGGCSTQTWACVWVWGIVTADRMTWLGTFLSLFGVHECILSGQMVCMWSFEVYCNSTCGYVHFHDFIGHL